MKAQDGKVYKNIITGDILGNEIWLGCNDSEDNYVEIDIPNPIDEEVERVKQSKIAELSTICTETIYKGINIQLSDGNSYPFTLDMQDQANLTGIALQLGSGATSVSWHIDDITQPCMFYSAVDAQTIINTLTIFKTYHTTYFRDLRRYLITLNTVEEINDIEYGYELSENDKSDVLKYYESVMNSETD